MSENTLFDRFVEILGAEAVLRDDVVLDGYATDYTEQDARQPGLVVLPSDAGQVQAVVRLAGELGCSLTVRVSGSNVGGLAIPPEGGVVVDLSRMNRIVDINADDMVAVIEPGVTWEQLKAHLAEHDIPLRMGYPLSPPDTSIVANCLLDGLGNLSMRYGSMGLWIGGLEVVLADGSIAKTGAPALSDVWFGRAPLPDLTGLFVSTQGTTGIVTKMGFELYPKPRFRRRLFILMYERDDTFAAMRDLCRMQICDDVGGLSWPTGKMLFGVQRPAERDPGEPEFFLYLDLSGWTEREIELRHTMLNEFLDEKLAAGVKLEKPFDINTLIRLNPQFSKFAEFPTRLEFLVDHPGGGLSWVGTYGPLSRFEAYADIGHEIMARYSMPPILVSRPMKGGHYGVMRFIATFDKDNEAERKAVREMNVELVDAGVKLGFIPYKTPPWTVKQLNDRLDPGFRSILKKTRNTLDPKGIFAPHCWPVTEK